MYKLANLFVLSILILCNESQANKPKSTQNYQNTIGEMHNCAQSEESGLQGIFLPKFRSTIAVICDQETRNGGWTLVLHRNEGKIDFANRIWSEYIFGFGDANSEYFIGLDKLHQLTSSRAHTLLIMMKDFNDTDYVTHLVEFEISDQASQCSIKPFKSFDGTEIGLSPMGAKFETRNSSTSHEISGWHLSSANSKQTKQRLNLFGSYWKKSNEVFDENVMGFYNEETKELVPLRSIRMLIRPVNMYRTSYGHTYAKLY